MINGMQAREKILYILHPLITSPRHLPRKLSFDGTDFMIENITKITTRLILQTPSDR